MLARKVSLLTIASSAIRRHRSIRGVGTWVEQMQGPDADDAAVEVMDSPAVWRDATVRAAQHDAVAIAGWGP